MSGCPHLAMLRQLIWQYRLRLWQGRVLSPPARHTPPPWFRTVKIARGAIEGRKTTNQYGLLTPLGDSNTHIRAGLGATEHSRNVWVSRITAPYINQRRSPQLIITYITLLLSRDKKIVNETEAQWEIVIDIGHFMAKSGINDKSSAVSVLPVKAGLLGKNDYRLKSELLWIKPEGKNGPWTYCGMAHAFIKRVTFLWNHYDPSQLNKSLQSVNLVGLPCCAI